MSICLVKTSTQTIRDPRYGLIEFINDVKVTTIDSSFHHETYEFVFPKVGSIFVPKAEDEEYDDESRLAAHKITEVEGKRLKGLLAQSSLIVVQSKKQRRTVGEFVEKETIIHVIE